MRLFVILGLSLCVAGSLAIPTIEHQPVRVTHRNSGPKYEIEDQREQEQPSVLQVPLRNNGEPKPVQSDDDESRQEVPSVPIVAIRRVFLTPVRHFDDEQSPPRSFPRFIPFHEDQSVRSPSLMDKPESSDERPSFFMRPSIFRFPLGDRDEQPPVAAMDPMQMMLELLRHTLAETRQMIPSNVDSNIRDLNKEASGGSQDKKPSEGEEGPISSERPSMPKSSNETQEDVVEIEGKKYLRKVVVNRHVGENIVFMTRRLIFTPLNETDSDNNSPSTTTTTQAPPSTDSTLEVTKSSNDVPSSTVAGSSTTEAASEATTTPEQASSTTTTPAVASSETVSSSESPSTTVGSGSAIEKEEMTTTMKPWLNRAQDAIEKLAGRLEASSTTAPEPSAISTEKASE